MKTGLIVCAALGREVREIVRRNGWDVEIISVPSDDHLFPMRIAPDVEECILKLRDRCDYIVVVFGECGSMGKLDEVLTKYKLHRIDARNCYEMYAGERYHEFVKEEIGTFFLTDFLVQTFHRAVIQGLGLDLYPELKESYFHNCTRLVYLIQNDSNELRVEAQAIADFMELPLQFHETGCENLENRIKELMNRGERSNGLLADKTKHSGKSNIPNELLMYY